MEVIVFLQILCFVVIKRKRRLTCSGEMWISESARMEGRAGEVYPIATVDTIPPRPTEQATML